MRVFAIGDIHLSFNSSVNPACWSTVKIYKPMDIFGEEWHEHYRKIFENWIDAVDDDDLVLMPGDISWAMRLAQACYDLEFLGLLPGTIVCVSGNHDYWWQSPAKVRSALPGNIKVIQNDSLVVNDIAVCGSRGWACPGSENFSDEDLKIYRRELIRMELSLKSVRTRAGDIIVATHFMPVNERHEKNELIEMFLQYGVGDVVYGHLHGASARLRLPDSAWGIRFHLCSADFINFTPRLIMSKV